MASLLLPFPKLPRLASLLTSSTLLYFLLALLLLNLVYRTHRWSKLRHVPGPFLAGWTSLWLTRRFISYKVYEDMHALTKRYGPVVRVGPNKVIINDLNTIYRITSARSEYKKGDWYILARVMPGADNLLSMRDPKLRAKRLRHVLPAFSGKNQDDFEPAVDKTIATLLDLIDTKYLSTPSHHRPMNLAQKSHFYTLDSFGEIAYSQSFRSLDTDSDVLGIVKTGDATFPMLSAVHNHHKIFQIIQKWPFYYLLPREGDKVGFGAVFGLALDIVNQRSREGEEGKDKKRDMLQSMMDHGLEGDELRSEVAMSFFVGSDTVASAIRITMLLLMTHPAAYRRLQEEIDDAAERGKISRPVTNEEAKRHLPYMQAVIQESLRLFPPSSIVPFFKEVPETGDTVNGHYLPKGTTIGTGCVMWSMNHDEDFWGPDVNAFRPERWLEADEERRVEMGRCVDLIFGSGKFVCAGKTIAFMQMYKLFPELLRRYNWSLPDPLRLPTIDNPTIWDIHGLMVRVEKR
ncbi:putative cytochrome P450 E-class, group IV [Cercophora samala]|uniref:Cytochrome P450 E-class, group IV n=1 Tax=Cercophora samala TaxID=330535 RepID=A0AA39YKB6_9PEZI|nr:putative cytochrome P450 E-class, group IV [Cercophora samala]